MPYIGQKVPGSYQAIKAVQRFNGDGSDTTFTLNTTVSSVQDVLVSVDGVVQDTAVHYCHHSSFSFWGGCLPLLCPRSRLRRRP